MPKSKPPRRRGRAPGRRPVAVIGHRTIAHGDEMVRRLQALVAEVETVAHKAPPAEIAAFRNEVDEAVRCWASVRLLAQGAGPARPPIYQGIARALEEGP